MTQCRFCKSDIPSDETRCPHCTSFLDGEPPQGSPGQVTYIVDKGLVTFGKFAGALLAIFVTLGLTLYGVDLKQLGKEIETTNKESHKLAVEAKMDLEKGTDDIKKDVEAAEAAANVAKATSSRAGDLLRKAEEEAGQIHEYKITLLAPVPGSRSASSPPALQPGPDPTQVDRLVEAKLLETLKDVLPPKQYSALQTRIGAEKRGGLRRQVFDAKNTTNLPGDLVRSEGDAPILDSEANEVYDNLAVVYRFFKDVFGRESLDNHGKTLVASVHYRQNYDNAFWKGQQMIYGDGDGVIFQRFTAALDVTAFELTHGITQFTAQLAYEYQSGALNMSMSDVFGSMVKQWALGQTVDQADWLIGGRDHGA